ncbi:MAG: DNA recombination protein RmuC [Melioribacteraceae bacterium]|nr:DNA recombination protein RmuC [Melioribacteraceae bacterium]MCF8264463.1 DNA recombination protein RmuC [Melioribacteraceae bacterium]
MPVISIALLLVAILLLVQIYRKSLSSSINDEIKALTEIIENKNEKLEKGIREEFSNNRDQGNKTAREQREELNNSVQSLAKQLSDVLLKMNNFQKQELNDFSAKLEKLTKSNEEKIDKLQAKVESGLKDIQENNSKKLEEMRRTVDEKLHETLEKRLGESFKVVSSQLKSVYEGLGEMQKLATGVGDLKRVLTNVKSRGTWGEVQLGALIEQVLTIDQYAKNVKVKRNSNDLVEFAIKLPGSNDEDVTWIPVDAKFPMEDYQRLLEAQDAVDPILVDSSRKSLEANIKKEAKRIQEKYIDPPQTTDFAIMFLPVEGLYAEVLRIPGLADFVQRECRVTITGPTTFLAVMNSLQMGFRTLAIEKRSSEVWKLLGTVKTEFGNFGTLLEKTHKKLQEASNSIDTASRKSRTIERRLRDVQELPSSGSEQLFIDE